ncbi:MAG TPA: anthranilate phosphoribosyltransferase [Polyangiaceae bacterium]
MSNISFSQVFSELTSTGLSPERVRQVFDAILAGTWTPTQIAGLLVALRFAGESAEVLAAAAASMRAAMVRVEHGLPRLLDTCGTGGDHSGSLNLSTGAAVIVAAAGVPVGKHGNRAASSRTGTADVLEAMGVPIDVPAPSHRQILAEANITFFFAQAHHPAMRHAGPVRKELGIRTIFNCLGPLANPAGATHQLLGSFDDGVRTTLARALATLGTERAWVVRSTDGMDEVSPYAPTRVTVLERGRVDELTIAPEDFGIPTSPAGAAQGGDPTNNAKVLEAVLRGEPHPSVDAFVLNAAAALVVADGVEPRAAAARAREAIASGAAWTTLERWRSAAQRARPASKES